MKTIEIRQTGFTIVELLTVVAIVGVLAAVALPAAQDYSKRAKMAEAVLAASSCRDKVSEVFQTANNGLPAANEWGCEQLPAASKYVDRVETTSNGTILVYVHNFSDTAIDGNILALRPLDLAGNTPSIGRSPQQWRCGSEADGTTIPKKFLPGSCKA